MTNATIPPRVADPPSFQGLRVGVIGLGVEGQDAVRFAHREGATAITVADRKSPERLAEQRRALNGIPFQFEQGEDPAVAERIDVLFVSQGVPDTHPIVEAARRRGVPITAMMRLFLQRCPAPVIGISGSAGKTTTTALAGEMFRAAEQPLFVGGNIGTGLLAPLREITPTTKVVVEISHTQLLRTDRSPHLAVLLNVTPNHLDQFSWEQYINLKRNLLRYQRSDDIAVLSTDNAVARSFAAETPARVYAFGLAPPTGPGTGVREGWIVWQEEEGAEAQPILPLQSIPLRGAHNVQNVLAAVAIGCLSGLPKEAMAKAVETFQPVAHRLEEVATIDGVLYVNDSIATTPERTLAAIRSYDAPVVLLLGGRDKRLPLEALVQEAHRRARAILCFGEAGGLFAAALRAGGAGPGPRPEVQQFERLEEAVAAAHRLAQHGDVVLLSPAGTSFDAYDDFTVRGDHFRALVRAWQAACPGATEGADGPRG